MKRLKALEDKYLLKGSVKFCAILLCINLLVFCLNKSGGAILLVYQLFFVFVFALIRVNQLFISKSSSSKAEERIEYLRRSIHSALMVLISLLLEFILFAFVVFITIGF